MCPLVGRASPTIGETGETTETSIDDRAIADLAAILGYRVVRVRDSDDAARDGNRLLQGIA